MNHIKKIIESDKRLSLAERIAKEVGKYQLSKLGEKIKIDTKSSPIDLVTEVDINPRK
ncbi:MAG: hypothetical protein R2883_04010 [Caldisericia bacterium]